MGTELRLNVCEARLIDEDRSLGTANRQYIYQRMDRERDRRGVIFVPTVEDRLTSCRRAWSRKVASEAYMLPNIPEVDTIDASEPSACESLVGEFHDGARSLDSDGPT